MKVIGIESSTSTASVAVIDDKQLIGEYTINQTLQHSKTLMPMLKELMDMLNLKMKDIDLIAVSQGPGSFTGLRIGSATAKGLAHPGNLPVAQIPTLEVIASQIKHPDARIGVIQYARATEVYYAEYNCVLHKGEFIYKNVKSIVSLEIDELITNLDNLEPVNSFYLVGDGISRFKDKLSRLNDKYITICEIYTNLSGKNVAILGKQRYYYNDVMTYQHVKPYYHKKSQAEREYDEKHSGKSND